MKVQDPHFILEKIRKYLDEDIRPTRYREIVDIEEWKYFETDMDDRIDDAYLPEYDDSGWADFRLWDTWGGYDKVAWFRTTVKIPESFRDGRIAVKLLVGPRDGGDSTAETLLYINGSAVQGIDIWHEEALLEETFNKETKLQLSLKAWSGVLVPPKFRTFKVAQLVKLDERVDKFCFVVDTLLRCVLLLDEGDLRRIRMTRLLNDTFKKVNFLNYKEEEYYGSVYEALEYIQENLEELAGVEEIKPTVYGVGHSHIDMAWLWRLNATREKASRTFSTVLNLMKQYPEYCFMHTSPQLYKFLKEDYPEIFSQVKEKIEEGQWEITGGMWVEPDTNIPSGESLIRQFLYGKRYIREEFGKESSLAWLPDVFGYSGAMPQIMKKCGMKYFMTTKISWNQYNHFPYDTFWWKGIDGSEIFTHFITTPEDGSWFYTYNGHMTPEEVTGVWKNYKDKDKNDSLLIAYGWGDGGGGPTREMLETSRVMKNIPGIPRVRMTSAEGYFEKIYERTKEEELGKWDGELYFELHRGTYTSQAANKKYNRKTEVLLHDIEMMAELGTLLAKKGDYPKEKLDEMWERTLLNQFHDILPGSSIRQVYEDTARDYEWIKDEGTKLLRVAGRNLDMSLEVEKDSLVLYNTAGYERSDYVCIPYGGQVTKGMCVWDKDTLVRGQDTEDGILLYAEHIPACGFKTFAISLPCGEESAHDRDELTMGRDHAENRFYEVRFNENGEICYLFDKENNRKVTCDSPMNLFAAYEDKPQRFDAWDVDVYYKEKKYAPFVLQKRDVVECGAERAVLRQVWTFNASTVTQDFILYAKSRRIDFATTVDWREKQVFFKTYFPVDIHSTEASYEIQFGNIKRPTHTNTEWDFARFEVPGHRWADLSEGSYGAALLNDCKYGWDIHENVLGLSLIKSAVRPDETADRRIHTFTYSLFPHKGGNAVQEIQREAQNLNMPLLTGMAKGSKTGTGAAEFSLVRTDSGHVMIDTIKRSEDGTGCVVRLYEFANQADTDVSLVFGIPVKKVIETNLCEEEEKELEFNGNQIHFGVGCYEIKTFKVYF